MSRWWRWVHVYGSMLILSLLLFFSVTGITLNHPELRSSLGAQSTEVTLQLPSHLQQLPFTDDALANAASAKQIANWLRESQQILGAVEHFRFEPSESVLELDFKRPAGYSNAEIDLKSGEVVLLSEHQGVLALLNDLHKGRDAGFAWKLLLDIAALLCIVVAVSGLYLLWRAQKLRHKGLYTASIATVLVYLVYQLALHP